MNDDELKTNDLSPEELEVRALYQSLLESWNRQDAQAMASLFTGDGHIVGFDGSTVDSQEQILHHLQQVFSDHVTAAYVAKVRSVEFLAAGIALLRAVAGMIPQGGMDINPAVNAVQTLLAVKPSGSWRIVLFQNTPAQFHGRPELAEQLTAELRQLLQPPADQL